MQDTLHILVVGTAAEPPGWLAAQLAPCANRIEMAHAATPESVAAALARQAWDVVIGIDEFIENDSAKPNESNAWNTNPDFDLVRQHAPDVAFVMVSGTLDGNQALESLRNGVDDVVLTSQPAALPRAVAHALAHAEARHAQAAVRRERLFSDSMIDSMPGVLYFYDEQGQFLRWNQNFAKISGYSAAEIAHMHPLDFFAGDDKPLLAQKIAEVMAQGEGFVEADFVSKHGHATPYFFTGKRVELDGLACLVGMGIDMSERKQAEVALAQYARRLQAMSRQLLDIQENERRLLARELHDSVGQELTALSLNLSIIRAALPAGSAPSIATRLDDSQTLIEDTTRHLRNVMVELRPPGLDELGLLAALKDHAQRVAQRSGLRLSIKGTEPRPRLTPATAIALFRIVQEALNNTVKHAQASEITIELAQLPHSICLTVTDDGCGFDTRPKPVLGAYGMGTTTMRERAEAIHAQLRIQSAPGQGTQTVIEVPRAPVMAAGARPSEAIP